MSGKPITFFTIYNTRFMIDITSQLSQIAQKLQIMRRPPCRRDPWRTAHLSRKFGQTFPRREQTFPNWRAALIDTHPKTSLIAVPYRGESDSRSPQLTLKARGRSFVFILSFWCFGGCARDTRLVALAECK